MKSVKSVVQFPSLRLAAPGILRLWVENHRKCFSMRNLHAAPTVPIQAQSNQIKLFFMTQNPAKNAAHPPQPNPAMPTEGRGWTPKRNNAVNRRKQSKQSFFSVACSLLFKISCRRSLLRVLCARHSLGRRRDGIRFAPDDDDPRALLFQFVRGGEANAAVPAGDDGCLILEFHDVFVRCC